MDQSDETDIDCTSEWDDVSDSDSDFEVKSKKRLPKTATFGTPPIKRPARKAAALSNSSLGVPGTATPTVGSLRPISLAQEQCQTTAGDLYEAVKSGRSALVTVVDEWLDTYKQDKEKGLLELINFVVQCCGCKGVVNREMFTSMQNVDIISRLTKDFNEDSVNYPLSSPGPQWRRFRAGLCEFMGLLVRRCQNSLLYDEYLFSSLLALLTGLSDSQVRAFRHTSSLMALKLMTAFVGVAVEVFAQTETTLRRYELERSKELEQRAQERMEELHASYTELREHQEELQSMMNGVFKGVFVHRYRDRLPEIRAICIEEMGAWLREHPSIFLNDGYLKYLGWTLHDKHSTVRFRSVRALQGLYREKDFVGRLELFTSRFKERLLNMVLDKDWDVAVEVVQLLLLMHQITEEGLSEEDCERVYPLVFASHRGLACSAGAFLYQRLCCEMERERRGEMESRQTTFLKLLVSFYIQTEFHEHGAYLVDSLWSCAGAELRDWEAMTSQLLQEKGQVLEDEEEGALIELMMCAVRQAAESQPPVGRAPRNRILIMKEKKAQVQDRRRITSHFIPVLPQLLAKYSADVEKVTSLLKAPLHFDLEAYSSTSRLKKYLDLLLNQVCGIVEKHRDEGVLDACARLACALGTDKFTFSSRADLMFSQLLDCLVDRFTSNLNNLLQGSADEDEEYSAATTLKRIAAFSSAIDLTRWRLFEPCLQILNCGIESREMHRELMVSALKCAAFHVFWEKVRITDSSPTKSKLKQLKHKVDSFCVSCQSCLSVGEPEIRDQAFVLLCDLLLVFSFGSVRSLPALQMLACPPCMSLRADMASFLLDFVFTEPEDGRRWEDEEREMAKITALQRRRSQLAGYCKLVIYGVLELSSASDIFKYYSKFYKDYGDIIKETLRNSKVISPVQSAKTLCLSLQQLYSQLPQDIRVEEMRSSPEFVEMRELAVCLALTFGIDLHRVRKPLVSLHKDGIRFSFRDRNEGDKPPPNLLFLEILSEFSFKLLRQDRAQLSGFLKQIAPIPLPAWSSLNMYQRSLQTRAKDREGERSTPAPKRRRTSTQGLASSDKEGLWLEKSRVHSTLATPPLTSTALRPATRRLPLRDVGTSEPMASSDLEISDPESQDAFTEQVDSKKKHQISPLFAPSPSSTHSNLGSHLNLLTLVEEDGENENQEIQSYESEDSSDQVKAVTLPSTRHSTSYLEDLFE